MATPRPIGIDLGTTNSCVATIDSSGRTAMVRNAEGDILTPSVVFFDDTEVVVGKEARKVAAIKTGQVAEWVKRDMGSPVYSRPIRGQYLPPEVIQACVLRKLRSDAVASLGPDLAAVITVPAYFDEPRRKATADAGEMAGLAVLDIVNEPTAAALAFGESLGYLAAAGVPRERMNVAVYDLGGGTFDATLLRLAPGDIRTLATDGDVQLGGFDWDMRLLNHAADWFKTNYRADPRDDPASWQRLYDGVVEAKHSLTARARATIRIEHAGHSAECLITREQFQELTADLLERTAYTSRQLMTAAQMKWPDLNRILLVGGSTRMPVVPQMLQQMTGLAPDHTVNPDEAVARGAALFANYLLAKRTAGTAGPMFRVTDVNAHSLGIEGIDQETLRKTNVILIPRNTALPARFTHRFVTRSENQRSIAIQVLEGESTLPGECNAIGRTVIRDLPMSLPKGWPVEITFEYGTNGRLNVHAVVQGTPNAVTLELERDNSLSIAGISRWKQVVCDFGGFSTFANVLPEASPGGLVSSPQQPSAAPGPALSQGAERPATFPEPSPGMAAGAPPPLPAEKPFVSQPAPLVSPTAPAGGQPVAQIPMSTPYGTSAPGTPATAPAFAPDDGLRAIPEPAALRPMPEPMPIPADSPHEVANGGYARSNGAPPGRIRLLVVNFLGYAISGILGLAVGYWIIRWLAPGIPLPSLF